MGVVKKRWLGHLRYRVAGEWQASGTIVAVHVAHFSLGTIVGASANLPLQNDDKMNCSTDAYLNFWRDCRRQKEGV